MGGETFYALAHHGRAVGSQWGVEQFGSCPRPGCLHDPREAFLQPTDNLKNVVFDS
jgi:hypothetical protein